MNKKTQRKQTLFLSLMILSIFFLLFLTIKLTQRITYELHNIDLSYNFAVLIADLNKDLAEEKKGYAIDYRAIEDVYDSTKEKDYSQKMYKYYIQSMNRLEKEIISLIRASFLLGFSILNLIYYLINDWKK